MERCEEIVVEGRLRESIDVPELGLALEVRWTDGRRFRGVVSRRSRMSRKRPAEQIPKSPLRR